MVVERRNFYHAYDSVQRVMSDWDDKRDTLSHGDAGVIILRNNAYNLGIFRSR